MATYEISTSSFTEAMTQIMAESHKENPMIESWRGETDSGKFTIKYKRLTKNRKVAKTG